MTAPKVGDRVRVVLEGVVKDVEPDNFQIGPLGADNVIFPDAEHVISVEILRPPVKVGDVIDTAEQLDALPVGAVVREAGHFDDPDVCERSDSGWHAIGVTHEVPPVPPMTVLYLPDGAP
jgi:hypothetical protein